MKKLIGIFICLLFFGSSIIPSIASYDKYVGKTDFLLNENETLNIKNDNNNNQIKQVIESGVIPKNNWFEQEKLLPSDGATLDCFGGSVSIDGNYAIIGADYDNDNGYRSGSAYVFKRDGTTWNEQTELFASDGAEKDYFGMSVSINGDYAIIGADNDDDNGFQSGSAYVFKREGITWTEQAKLLPSDGAYQDRFGYSVSINGDFSIIGAYHNDDNGQVSGSAYVFKREGTTWTEQAKLLPSDGEADDWFGSSVSINGDYAIIGAYNNDDNGFGSGSAYVFIRNGTNWTEQAKLLPSDGAYHDCFGISVSIDGNYAIIGAYNDKDNGEMSGSAYVFIRNNTNWTEQAKLLPSDGAYQDWFGLSVSIDGNYAIIGAHTNDDNGENSGSAYIFKRDDTNWTNLVKLLASDGATEDWFGESVSIDGNYAIIGAHLDDDNGQISGSAYVFRGNQPPNKPTCSYIAINDILVIYATDPDGDQVRYGIDWDDDLNVDQWTSIVLSGTQQRIYCNGRNDTVGTIVEDEYGAQSEWTSVKSKNKQYTNTLFLQFLENLIKNYPNLFPILKTILGL
jgi:hypothetical protein